VQNRSRGTAMFVTAFSVIAQSIQKNAYRAEGSIAIAHNSMAIPHQFSFQPRPKIA
jgi:hypothetical protein